MPENSLAAYREFLKDTIRRKIDFSQTDQNQGVPPPPLEKPYPPEAVRIRLLPVGQWQGVESIDLASAIEVDLWIGWSGWMARRSLSFILLRWGRYGSIDLVLFQIENSVGGWGAMGGAGTDHAVCSRPRSGCFTRSPAIALRQRGIASPVSLNRRSYTTRCPLRPRIQVGASREAF